MTLITVNDVAKRLGIGAYRVREECYLWRDKYGVEIVRLGGKPHGHIRFYEEQIDDMIKKWGQN